MGFSSKPSLVVSLKSAAFQHHAFQATPFRIQAAFKRGCPIFGQHEKISGHREKQVGPYGSGPIGPPGRPGRLFERLDLCRIPPSVRAAKTGCSNTKTACSTVSLSFLASSSTPCKHQSNFSRLKMGRSTELPIKFRTLAGGIRKK